MNGFKKNYFSFFLLLLILSLGAVFTFTQAQNLETDYPQVPGAETPITTKTPLPEYVKYIFNFSVWLAGFIALGTVFYGGVRYLTSAGSASATSEAKKQIFAGIFGLIVLLSSYIILNTINPQLLFFNIPEPDFGTAPPVVVPPPLIEQTLFAEEIPFGKFIDGIGEIKSGGSATSLTYSYESVLAETRLERIIGISEEIWNTAKKIQKVSKEISDASQELENLVRQCVCSNCSSDCGGCDSCPCNCNGDPCGPVRGAIIEQQAILSTKYNEFPPLKAKIEMLSEKLAVEKEKLEKALIELEKGELLAKKCPSSISSQGKTSVLLSYSDFWAYKEGIESGEIIKEMKVKKTWDYMNAGNDESTFYCAETPFEVSSIEEVSTGDISELISGIESSLEQKLSCQIIIPIGESVDYSEDIANRLIGEFFITLEDIAKTVEEIPKETENSKNISPLPNCYHCSNWCSCACSAVICCDEFSCWCCGCELAQSCQGSPCPEDKKKIQEINTLIQKNHQVINDAYNSITASDDELHNLINGDEIHDKKLTDSKREPSWSYDILKRILPATRNAFRRCVNLAGDWTEALSGEKLMTKNVLICEEAKSTCSDLEEGYVCYGEGDSSSFPNYFCGEIESK